MNLYLRSLLAQLLLPKPHLLQQSWVSDLHWLTQGERLKPRLKQPQKWIFFTSEKWKLYQGCGWGIAINCLWGLQCCRALLRKNIEDIPKFSSTISSHQVIIRRHPQVNNVKFCLKPRKRKYRWCRCKQVSSRLRIKEERIDTASLGMKINFFRFKDRNLFFNYTHTLNRLAILAVRGAAGERGGGSWAVSFIVCVCVWWQEKERASQKGGNALTEAPSINKHKCKEPGLH